ncbi:MAG: CIA30 family protein [Rhodothermales bacterium]
MNLRHVLLVTLLLAGCSDAPTIRPMIGGEVDDFEDGDPYSLLGTTWTAVADGGETTATIFVDSQNPHPGSVYHLTVGGQRPLGSAGNQVSGVRLPMGAEGTAADVSTFDGLELSMRGSMGTFIVQLGTASVSDFDYFNAYIVASDEWTTFQLPFSKFNQEGFGKRVTFTGEDVTHIAVFSGNEGPYDIAIDDIRFYRAEDPDQD